MPKIKIHEDNCAGITVSDECEPVFSGQWLQPQGRYVDLATEELGDETPWCQLHLRAWELQDSDDT
jgi:hypothetical protein